ncbi:MAG: DUF885 domain-containing protein [Chloroflexota bacterium]|nr:DUF885 domain-containing protein [Chloroflexota bacterium]MDQ5865947.1 DUF885 domain-containing protein [Chloroflexota bacterium]
MPVRNGQKTVRLCLAFVMALLAIPLIPPSHAYVQSDSRTFPETGKTVKGRFLTYWNEHGGLPQQGYPISGEMQEKSDTDGRTYTVQYFERAVFEHHPENAAPNDVLLSLLGNFVYKQKYPNGAPAQKPNTSAGSQLFQQTGKRVGGLFLDYWQKHGGLAQQGYPISDEFTEKSALDGKTYTVQYFERAVFEHHPENQPPFNVLLSQLGTFRYQARYSATNANLTLDQFYEKAFQDILLRDPELFSALGLPKSYYPDFRHNQLTNLSDEYTHQTYALMKQTLDRLRAYDKKTQTPKQQVSTGILEWWLDDTLRGEEFMYHEYIINPIYGAAYGLYDLMVNLQSIANKQDAEDYIARLEQFDTRFDQLIEALKLRDQRGLHMPKWLAQASLGQIRSALSDNATSSAYYTAFRSRVEALGNVSAAEKEALYASARNAIEGTVNPAYRKLIDYVSTLVNKGRSTDGVWALPNGDAYYRWIVRRHTNTDMTPEEIHNLGLKEVARIRGEIRAALDALGHKNPDLKAAMNEAARASGAYATNTQAGRDDILNAFRNAITEAEKNISGQFDVKPKARLEVRAVEGGGGSGAYYVPPAVDGSRPGVFYVNLGRPSYNKYEVPTLAYHEGVPGHHFQLGIQTELQNVPMFQKSGYPMFTSYAEGWALYAEKLMYEAGAYKNDPYGNLGRLQAELFRAARLVVDTGIHYKRWNASQANAYMDETLFFPPGGYSNEVNRYIMWPGQALSYKVGELRILEVRQRAKDALGSKFNIKEFHNVLLQNGGMPLPVLELAVENYIAGKR